MIRERIGPFSEPANQPQDIVKVSASNSVHEETVPVLERVFRLSPSTMEGCVLPLLGLVENLENVAHDLL
jgi:hypothetical protein